jgi:hypothetical protein
MPIARYPINGFNRGIIGPAILRKNVKPTGDNSASYPNVLGALNVQGKSPFQIKSLPSFLKLRGPRFRLLYDIRFFGLGHFGWWNLATGDQQQDGESGNSSHDASGLRGIPGDLTTLTEGGKDMRGRAA